MITVVDKGKWFVLGLAFTVLVGCAATQTSISKRELDVQTKMSQSIFLDPVAPEKRVVLVQVRNTSDRPDFDVENEIRSAIMARGYRLTENPDEATYMVQANVLQVGMVDPTAAEQAYGGGFGGAVTGAVAGGAVGSVVDRDRVGTAAVIGAGIGFLADSMVKDVTYSIITDVQISERAGQGVTVREDSRQTLPQGTSGSTSQRFTETSEWKRYRTRVMSIANKANLKFEEAAPKLVEGLTRSIAGIL